MIWPKLLRFCIFFLHFISILQFCNGLLWSKSETSLALETQRHWITFLFVLPLCSSMQFFKYMLQFTKDAAALQIKIIHSVRQSKFTLVLFLVVNEIRFNCCSSSTMIPPWIFCGYGNASNHFCFIGMWLRNCLVALLHQKLKFDQKCKLWNISWQGKLARVPVFVWLLSVLLVLTSCFAFYHCYLCGIDCWP